MQAKAINQLIANGLTLAEAAAEFNDRVNYHLRGTLHDAGDHEYAVECAADDILDGCEEDCDEDYLTMLDLIHK